LRQAVALLVTQGLLERQHGRGTFVRAGIGGATMLRFFRFRAGKDLSAVPSSEILRARTVKASAMAASALGVNPSDEILELLRLRSLQGVPCLLETIQLPLPLFAALAGSDAKQWGDLLYPLFQSRCGVTVNRAEDMLRFSVLTKEQGRRLGLPTGHPCVQVERRAFDLSGRCIERRITLGDAHAFQYTLNIH
jgi:GntR family transcriptional regulator